jgi:hypothetical protein
MREFRQMKQLCAFQGTMKEITETFQTVSLAIIQLSKELKEAGHLQSSKYCEDLQELEQTKLKLVSMKPCLLPYVAVQVLYYASIPRFRYNQEEP